MNAHRVVIDEPKRATDEYWWACSCGDEGGPHEAYGRAWDSWVEHTRRADRRERALEIRAQRESA